MGLSLYEQMKTKPKQERLDWLAKLPEKTVVEIAHKPWWYLARPEQQEPEGNWSVWLILSGRGWGKTRTGGEWLAEQVLRHTKAPDGVPTQWAIIAPTFGDAKNICLEGPSGFLKALDYKGLVAGTDYIYNKSSYKVLFSNGQVVHMFGADTPDAGRGLNLSGAWLDELAMWNYPYETWTEGLAPALRIGRHPRVVVTTTPKPIKLLREWMKRTDGSVHVTRGSTFDNANNLSPTALLELKARYENTRIGRQELYGELLEDVEGALWTRTIIDKARITKTPPLIRIVVGVDPAVTSTDESDETGIVVAGIDNAGHYYVLDDKSLRATPDAWARVAVEAYHKHNADRIVAETNNGGDMIILLMQQVDRNVSTKKVTATRGKQLRAEPISSLYEQGRVHHVGYFGLMEEQMCEWTPESKDSPDRLDALVWALTELNTGGSSMIALAAMSSICPSCTMPSPKGASICSACGYTLGVSA